ncbi:MAG: hypothetical protein AB1768_14815 [Pseudomonadota bacterium]
MPWLGGACGRCRFCAHGQENLCRGRWRIWTRAARWCAAAST